MSIYKLSYVHSELYWDTSHKTGTLQYADITTTHNISKLPYNTHKMITTYSVLWYKNITNKIDQYVPVNFVNLYYDNPLSRTNNATAHLPIYIFYTKFKISSML